MDHPSSALETASDIRRRVVSPLEVLDATLESIDRLNPDLNAIIWRNDDEARRDAKKLGDDIVAGKGELGRFSGVPIPIKDLTSVKGWPTTFGSHGAPEGPSAEDELVVAALRRAGFILTGRTNTPELGPITVTENLRYGITRNPWDTDYSPGGSSGGAAAAVAAGMFPFAHANDGGGSIRIPSSCCGLFGLKPSRWRVPAVVPGWLGAAVEGVVARSVADSAAVLDEISGPDPLSWSNAPAPDRPFADEVGADPGQLRIGLLTRAPLDMAVAPAPLEAVAVAGRLLESLGHHVAPIEFELFPAEQLIDFLNIVNAGMADYPEVDFERVEPHNQVAYATGRGVDSIAFLHSLGRLQRFSRQLVAHWGREFDLLVTPAMAIEPPLAGTVLAEAHATPDATPLDVVSMAVFCAPFNVSGQPAMSLPLHWSESGLPIGVQVVGGPWQESLLLRLASQLEGAAPWRDRRPAIAAA